MQEISYRSCRKYITESEICMKCLTEVVNCRKQLTESEKKNLFKNEKIKNFTKNAHRKLIFFKEKCSIESIGYDINCDPYWQA